jgi:hypothetical protein
MTARRRKTTQRDTVKPIDTFATLLDEITEAVELMRPHFPNDDEDTLRGRAMALRAERYRTGHWPDFEEMAKAEAVAAAESQADADIAF